MDKQTTIAFVLIGIILVVWLYMTAPEPVVEKPKQTDSTTIVIDTLQKEQEIKPIVKEPKTQENIPTQDTVSRKNEKITTIENEVFIVELSNIGGNIHKVFLKDFNNWYSINDKSNDYYEKSVQLINYSRGNTYNLSFVSTDGKAINTGDYTFTSDKAPGKYQINGKDSIIIRFTWKVGERQEIIKSYKFNGSSYEIGSKIELSGMRDVISNNAYDLVWNNGLRFVEYNTVDEANYSNSSVYYGDEQAILDASSVGEKVQEDYHGRIDWIAVRNKYFAAVIIPDNPSNVDGAYLEGDREQISAHGVEEYYNARLILPFKNTDNETRSFKLYIGPVDYNKLKSLGSHLKALVDFGSFFGLKFVVRPIAEYVLLPLFNFLHLFIPNYGFVIVVFSLIIKIVVYPLTKQSYQSMKKMQLLQPKIAEIKEKYKDDQQKLNKETMKLYQTYGVNPAGGCLPMLLQMPIFVALWGLFRTAIELRQQPFILWIKDLSQPDVIYNLGFKLPLFGIQEISGLALLMGITTFIQQKMTMKDPKQKAMVYVMPIFLTILFMSFPSGLNLYYFLFNLFSIAQQQYINHKHDGMELVPVKNPKKKQGFMSRLMEAAEQQSKGQQKRRR
ncbi:membrane protein insertase YidC [bacterium BMS3Abin03]|nr:membrane protein insertase YidC [bacterium BMS3Abin03]MCG6959739.1 membrane protein insertase YidC [bacterium BMS3Abin03]